MSGATVPERVAAIRATTEYVSWFPITRVARPCDQPPGCNARNCLGCGEDASGVQTAAAPRCMAKENGEAACAKPCGLWTCGNAPGNRTLQDPHGVPVAAKTCDEPLLALLNHIEDLMDRHPELERIDVLLWNAVTARFAPADGVASASLAQPLERVTDDDLTRMEAWLMQHHGAAAFIPVDAHRLANFTALMIREVRAARGVQNARGGAQ